MCDRFGRLVNIGSEVLVLPQVLSGREVLVPHDQARVAIAGSMVNHEVYSRAACDVIFSGLWNERTCAECNAKHTRMNFPFSAADSLLSASA